MNEFNLILNSVHRCVGSDIQANQKVLEKGMKLGAAELGILATVGVTKFLVFK
jgi:molybdopterin biosynthesis enzyme